MRIIILLVNSKRGVKLIWRSLVRLMSVVWTELMFQNTSIFDSIIKLFLQSKLSFFNNKDAKKNI